VFVAEAKKSRVKAHTSLCLPAHALAALSPDAGVGRFEQRGAKGVRGQARRHRQSERGPVAGGEGKENIFFCVVNSIFSLLSNDAYRICPRGLAKFVGSCAALGKSVVL